MVFETQMQLWTELIKYRPVGQVRLYPEDYFLPYNPHTGVTNTTENTRTHHAFNRSWLLPTVTFLVPTLNRPEGLKRCLDSIATLTYPKDLIDVITLSGEGTVPEKG